MPVTQFRWVIFGVIGALPFVDCSTGCAQQPEAAKASANEHRRVDAGKYKIELPTEQVVALAARPATGTAPAFVNPKVEPGKVKWHADFATARAASAKSGKPILLFQLLGRLDDQFC